MKEFVGRVWSFTWVIAMIFIFFSVFPVMWEIPFAKSPTDALHKAPYDMVKAVKHNATATWNWGGKVLKPVNSGIAEGIRKASS